MHRLHLVTIHRTLAAIERNIIRFIESEFFHLTYGLACCFLIVKTSPFSKVNRTNKVLARLLTSAEKWKFCAEIKLFLPIKIPKFFSFD